VVTSGGTSLVVKSGIDIAIGVVTVDCKEDRSCLGVDSPKLLADKEGFAEWDSCGGNAMAFQVDVNDGVRRGGPGAINRISSGHGICHCEASKALNIESRIVFGIGGRGGDGNCGRVSRPHSNSGIHSLHEDGVGCEGRKSSDIEVRRGRGEHLDCSSGGLIVDSVEVEGEQGGVRPLGTNINDVVEASVGQSDGGGGLRIGHGGGTS